MAIYEIIVQSDELNVEAMIKVLGLEIGCKVARLV